VTAKIDAITFEAGIVSPLVEARHTLLNHGRGCRRLENFISWPQGPVTADPGTAFVTSHDEAGRFARIAYSATQSFLAWFGDEVIRFFDADGVVLDGASAYEIASPYASADLADLKFLSDVGNLYIFHPDHAPRRIVFTPPATWTLELIPFEGGPYLDENETDITIESDPALPSEFEDGYTEDWTTNRAARREVYLAQTFTASATYAAVAVTLPLYKLFDFGGLHVSIRATEEGLPTGPDLASGIISSAVLGLWLSGTGVAWHTITFDEPVTLTEGTVYALVLAAPYAGKFIFWETNCNWMYDNAGAYAGGTMCRSTDYGVTWGVDQSAGDYCFRVLSEAYESTIQAVTLTASDEVFDAGHVGALWQLRQQIPETLTTYTLDADEPGRAILMGPGGIWTLTLSGTWVGLLLVERSYDGELTWETVAQFETNVTAYQGPAEIENAIVRARMSEYTSGSVSVELGCDKHFSRTEFRITAVASATSATATVVSSFALPGSTTYWSEGTWGGVRGWPRAAGLIENRLACMATTYDPTTIWLSRANVYHDFNPDQGALTFVFTTGTGDPFLWIHPGRMSWYVGTESAILDIAPASPNEALGHTNPLTIRRRVHQGACDIQPVMVGSLLVYVGSDRKRVLGTYYEWAQDRLLSEDLAFDCPGLTTPGLSEIVLQRTPFHIVWFRRSDGVVLGMTYEERPDRRIVGWHQHGSGICAIGNLPGAQQDRLWRVAERGEETILYHVERTDPIALGPARDTAHRLQAYLQFAGDPSAVKTISTIARLPHTEHISYFRVIKVTTDAAHGFTTGDEIAFRNCDNAPWMNTTFPIIVYTDTAFYLADEEGDYFNAYGLEFDTYWESGNAECGAFSDTFTGLGHLEGKSVYALRDGILEGPYTVTSGEVTLSTGGGTVYIGLAPDSSILQPLRLLLPTRSGSTRAHQLNCPGVWLSVFESLAGKVGRDLTHLESLAIDATDELVTDDFFVRIESGFSDDPQILVVADSPLPLTVRCIMLDTAVHGVRSL